jgi:hypothetical protein
MTIQRMVPSYNVSGLDTIPEGLCTTARLSGFSGKLPFRMF